MMLASSALKGFAIEASNGRIGTVSDFLFDDVTWNIRWVVVETGSWLTGRKILIHPSAVGEPDSSREELPVRLTKEQVKGSPDISSDEPVSRQMQTNLYGYYGWDPLWGDRNYFSGYSSSMGATIDPLPRRFDSDLLEASRRDSGLDDGDPHLRSVTEVMSYHIQTKDGPIGHIEDFLVNNSTWGIRYLVIETRNWWPGQLVLMSPHGVRGISWSTHDVTLDVTRDQVKASPAWDADKMVDGEYEQRLHSHYGWPRNQQQ